MKRGELADAAGISAKTVRFYEEAGLLPEPERTPSGYRSYGASDVRRLEFVRQAKRMGLSLPTGRSLCARCRRCWPSTELPSRSSW